MSASSDDSYEGTWSGSGSDSDETDLKKKEEYLRALEKEVALLRKLKDLERKREALGTGNSLASGRVQKTKRKGNLSARDGRGEERRERPRKESRQRPQRSADRRNGKSSGDGRDTSRSHGRNHDKYPSSSGKTNQVRERVKEGRDKDRQREKERTRYKERERVGSSKNSEPKKQPGGTQRRAKEEAAVEHSAAVSLPPISLLLETNTAQQLASPAVGLGVTDSIARALQIMDEAKLTAVPSVREGAILDIYNLISYLLNICKGPIEPAEFWRTFGTTMDRYSAQAPLDLAAPKPSWHQSGVSPSDSLLVAANNLTRDLQEVPIIPPNAELSTIDVAELKVVNQASLVAFLLENRDNLNLGPSFNATVTNNVRYLSSNATVATLDTPMEDLLENLVKSKTPLVAIVDETGSLKSTFHPFQLRPGTQWTSTTLTKNASLREVCEQTEIRLVDPLFCYPTSTLEEALELLGSPGGELGIWIVNEKNEPKELLHCTEILRYLLLMEKKQLEKRKSGTRKSLAMSSRAFRKFTGGEKPLNPGGGPRSARAASPSSEEDSDSDFAELTTRTVPAPALRKAPTPGINDTKGWLNKRSPAFHKQWQRRWFVLQDNELRYFKDSKDVVPCGLICLDGSFEVRETKDVLNGFALKYGKRKYSLSAETEKEKQDWLNSFQRVLDNIRVGLYDHVV